MEDFIPSPDNDKVGVDLWNINKYDVFDPEAYKASLDAALKNREIQEARAAREADQTQKANEAQQRALFHRLEALPNDIWAEKDAKLKAEAVNKISDYAYAHPELYDTKSKDRVKAQLEIDKLINEEKSAAMRSNAWQKQYIFNDNLYNQAFMDKTNPASPEDMYDYEKHKELGTEATAGDYTIITPHRKANIETHITKDMQKYFDNEIKNNPNKPVDITRVTNQFKHDLTADPEISLSNIHDYDKAITADPTLKDKYEAQATANNSTPQVEYGVDKHKETLNYLTGQYIKYAPRQSEREYKVAHGIPLSDKDIQNEIVVTPQSDGTHVVDIPAPKKPYTAIKVNFSEIPEKEAEGTPKTIVPKSIQFVQEKMPDGKTRVKAYATYSDAHNSVEYKDAEKDYDKAKAKYELFKDSKDAQDIQTIKDAKSDMEKAANIMNKLETTVKKVRVNTDEAQRLAVQQGISYNDLSESFKPEKGNRVTGNGNKITFAPKKESTPNAEAPKGEAKQSVPSGTYKSKSGIIFKVK